MEGPPPGPAEPFYVPGLTTAPSGPTGATPVHAAEAQPGLLPPGIGKGLLPPPPASVRVPLPGGGTIMRLPGEGDLLALTVDDGADGEVVRAYSQLAHDTGLRFTFFVTGSFPGWTEHAPLLRPLVESGQVQLGNHTWTHPWLTHLSAQGVAEELTRNRDFLKNTYGVDGMPYFRPPYGSHSASVDKVATDLGYKCCAMWYGSLADSGLVKEDFIVSMANQYFNPQAIVIGHANHPPVTHVYAQLIEVIKSRNLRTVTLNDVFLP